MIRERTHAGLAAARARGRTGGRRITHPQDRIESVQKLAEGETISQACKALGISRGTYYRRLKGEVNLSQEYLDWIQLLRQKAIGLREAAESFEKGTLCDGDVNDRIAEFQEVEEYFNEIKKLLENFVEG